MLGFPLGGLTGSPFKVVSRQSGTGTGSISSSVTIEADVTYVLVAGIADASTSITASGAGPTINGTGAQIPFAAIVVDDALTADGQAIKAYYAIWKENTVTTGSQTLAYTIFSTPVSIVSWTLYGIADASQTAPTNVNSDVANNDANPSTVTASTGSTAGIALGVALGIDNTTAPVDVTTNDSWTQSREDTSANAIIAHYDGAVGSGVSNRDAIIDMTSGTPSVTGLGVIVIEQA